MTLKENAIVLALLVAGGVGAAWYLRRQVSGAVDAYVPKVVQEGFGAAYYLGTQAVDTILHPLNAFGISPGNFPNGAPKYAITVPHESGDIVSDNDLGVNFNYF